MRPKLTKGEAVTFFMSESGELKNNDEIPKDRKRREAIVIDELTGKPYEFDIVCKASGPVFYVKDSNFRINFVGKNFANYTDRKFFKQLPGRYQKTFDDATVEYLQSICPDFDMLKKMIDVDLELLPTDVVEVKKGIKRSGEGKGERMKIEIKKKVEMWNVDIKPEDKTRIVKGDFQSRKTWATTAIALYYLLHARMSSFIVVQNSLDACDQILLRVREVFNKYVDHIENESLRDKFDELFQVLDIQRGKKADEDQVRKAMDGRAPRIFITLRNSTDIKPVNEMIEKMPTTRYITIIDESDENDSGVDSASQRALDVLKEKSKLVWDITATPLTNMAKDEIDKGNVAVLTTPEGYKKLPMVDFRDLKKPVSYCSKVDDNPFDKDKNLKGYIRDFAKTNPFKCAFYGERAPRYSLVRIGNTIQPQIRVAEFVHQKYGSRIVVITYNGSSEGVTLRGNALPTTPIILSDGKKSTYEEKEKVHKFPGCHIGKIIAWLQENGGVEKYPRIMALAGAMANRGISFGADNYSACFANKTLCWHLSELYFIAPVNMSQANLLQAAGRICGVFPDSVPLTLYTNVGRDIVSAYWSQEELIERARKMRGHKRIQKMLMSAALEEVELQKDKCVTGRRWTAPGVKFQPKKVADDKLAGGWDWKAEKKAYSGKEATFGEGERVTKMKKELSPEKILEIRKKVMEKAREEAKKRNSATEDIDIKEGIDYIKRAYSKSTTCIRKMIDKFVSEDFRALSVSELREATGTEKLNVTNYDRWDLSSHSKYKVLDRTGNKYNLNPQVIEALNLLE